MIDDSIPGSMPVEIVVWHAELIIDALDGAARQFDRARNFLRDGDLAAAAATYHRARLICLEFATPGFRALQEASELNGQAAAEWRAERDRSAARRPAHRVREKAA